MDKIFKLRIVDNNHLITHEVCLEPDDPRIISQLLLKVNFFQLMSSWQDAESDFLN